jgi:hypothetical protein
MQQVDSGPLAERKRRRLARRPHSAPAHRRPTSAASALAHRGVHQRSTHGPRSHIIPKLVGSTVGCLTEHSARFVRQLEGRGRRSGDHSRLPVAARTAASRRLGGSSLSARKRLRCVPRSRTTWQRCERRRGQEFGRGSGRSSGFPPSRTRARTIYRAAWQGECYEKDMHPPRANGYMIIRVFCMILPL